MIATDKLLFLHLHKSGGTFVNALLLRCVPSSTPVGYHLPYRETPPQFRELPVVGTVRSPWAYYVSWYHFQAGQQSPNHLYRLCSEDGSLGFDATIRNLVNLARDDQRLDRLQEALPDGYTKRGLNLTKADVADLRQHGAGFYSFLYERLYRGARMPRILRVERLRDELRRALLELGCLPDSCIEAFLSDAPDLNVSQHEDPAGYYDDDLAELVARRDRAVIDSFDYTLG